MARRTVVERVDDLDGSAATETVLFGLDGVDYEIDLSPRNATRLRSELERYQAAGRRLSPRPRKTSPPNPGATRVDSAQLGAIRDWAARRGMPINPRGRIPQEVLDAYHAGG
ncbi:MAG TPA: Lsr2 family protein [Sporichthyaceae bacterium]|nr:Lsr2 family protein [Sporichthyaceae bacterium]